jgi:hypothetical protein
MSLNKSYQLAQALKVMSRRILYEDIQMTVNHLLQCVTNILAAREQI